MASMDFDDILAKVGSFGKYQKLILFLVLFPATLPCGFFGWNQMFMSGTPHNYYCNLTVPNLNLSETISLLPTSVDYEGNNVHDKCRMYDLNYSDTEAVSEFMVTDGNRSGVPVVACKYGWVYNHSDWASTIVTEWDLVCDKDLYVTNAYTINGAGSLLSMFFLGFVADRYGRRTCYFVNYLIMMAFSVATAFAPDYLWFSIFRFIVGFGPGWAYTIPMMIAMELIGPEPRALMSVIVSVYYTVGFLALGGLSYLVSDWRPFALASCLPMSIFMGYWWIMPESPRWLLSRKRYKELSTFFEKVARVNGKSLDPEFVNQLPEILKKVNDDSQAADEEPDRRYSMLDLFRTRNLLKKTMILIFANICNLGVYLGLTFYGPSINTNPHWNFFLSGVAEMPGYLFTSFLCNRLGRRFALVSTMVIAGIAGLAAAGVANSSTSIIMGLVFLSKFAISIAFIVSELLEDEIFPTVVRGEGHSVTSFASTFFTLGVPYIVFLGHQYMALPLIIFGGVCIMAAFISLFLPETANTDLPQTLEDGELMGKHMTWKEIFSFQLPKKRRDIDPAVSVLELSPLKDEATLKPRNGHKSKVDA